VCKALVFGAVLLVAVVYGYRRKKPPYYFAQQNNRIHLFPHVNLFTQGIPQLEKYKIKNFGATAAT